MIRRKFFKTLFGAAAAVVGAPLVPVIKPIPSGIIYAPYIPMIGRVMPNLIAADLIGVQLMSGPSGAIFAMKLADNTNETQKYKKRVATYES